MLIKYVLTWNELALAFKVNGMFVESLECFQTAIIIYEKLLMYGHIQFALGDYILSKLMIYIGILRGNNMQMPLEEEKAAS